MELSASVLLSGLIGFVLVWLSRFPVESLIDRIKNGIPLPAPSATIEKKWTDLTTDPESDRSGKTLGDLERAFFYLAFLMAAQEIIAGWFALKVASKWEAWGTTGKLPETLDGIDPLDYAISRRRWASRRLMSFLVGTVANVFVAFSGFIIVKHALVPLLGRCF